MGGEVLVAGRARGQAAKPAACPRPWACGRALARQGSASPCWRTPLTAQSTTSLPNHTFRIVPTLPERASRWQY